MLHEWMVPSKGLHIPCKPNKCTIHRQAATSVQPNVTVARDCRKNLMIHIDVRMCARGLLYGTPGAWDLCWPDSDIGEQ